MARDNESASDTREQARLFFERELRARNLTGEQIEAQTFAQLKKSSQRIDDAMLRPESFGTITMPAYPRRGLFRDRRSQVEVTGLGILPLLLDAKALVDEWIKQLRPAQLPRVGIDSLVKALGVIGIVAFGILFTAYHQFYSAVGIKPEDVGITYTYVIARSVGLVLILVAAVAYL